MAQAQRDLDRVAAEIRGAYTDYNAENLQLSLASMQADAVRDLRPALTALFAGASFLLLICCVNVTSFLFSRATDRRKEVALRLAIGASRGRIVRQLLAEAAVLCLIGGSCGMALGWAGFRALLAIRPERLAHIGDPGLHWPLIGFAAAVLLGADLLFGLAPAIETFRLDLTESLRSSGRRWIGTLSRRTGAALVIGEITVSFVLVTGAALAARTLAKIEQINPGFEPQHCLTFRSTSVGPSAQVSHSNLSAIGRRIWRRCTVSSALAPRRTFLSMTFPTGTAPIVPKVSPSMTPRPSSPTIAA
jgi:hypothetical protein